MEAGSGGIRSVGEPAVDEGVLLVGSRRAVPHVHQYGRHVSESALHYCVRTRLVLHWDSAHHLLELRPPDDTYFADVNVAFSQTLVKMGFEGDSLINQFHFTLPAAVKQSSKALLGPKLQQDSAGKGWSLLGLTYRPQWPLQVVFTPPILEK